MREPGNDAMVSAWSIARQNGGEATEDRRFAFASIRRGWTRRCSSTKRERSVGEVNAREGNDLNIETGSAVLILLNNSSGGSGNGRRVAPWQKRHRHRHGHGDVCKNHTMMTNRRRRRRRQQRVLRCVRVRKYYFLRVCTFTFGTYLYVEVLHS